MVDVIPGHSPYAYVFNNPISFNDPTGMMGESPAGPYQHSPFYAAGSADGQGGDCPDCPDEVYVDIAAHVYDATEGSSVNGWQVVEGGVYENSETGFKGALYVGTADSGHEGEYIFATAGTSPTSVKDWEQNMKQLSGNSEQYSQSVGLAGALSKKYSGVSFTGHSLGGGLASANALATEGKAVTFNASGLSGQTKSKLGLTDKTAQYLSAYVVQGEAVSHYQAKLGLRAEGNITTLPASYVPRIPFSKADDAIRTGQRINNHLMGAVKKRF